LKGENVFYQDNGIQIALPSWLETFGQSYNTTLDVNERMKFVIAASIKNIDMQSGGPFAAAIFELTTGKLISLGVNLVTTQGLSILHAEMVAISLAQRKIASYDLSNDSTFAYELVTSTEPCAMCLGSLPWSGIRKVVTAASDQDAREVGFDEGAKPNNWVNSLTSRGIDVVSQIQQNEAKAVLHVYLKRQGKIYNTDNSS